MTKPCIDCETVTCARLHHYDAHTCKLSDGNPCQECFQMGLLDSQISKVHSQLVQLAQKRHTLKTKINQRHEPYIHRLPLAVSSEIFKYYVHHASDTFDPQKASQSEYTSDWSPAFFLSSICATWRKVALATPEIWRFINIPLLQDEPDVNLKIELFNECIDRAGQRSLFIGVFQFQLDEEPRFSQLEQKLGTLIPIFEAVRNIIVRSEEITLWGLPPGALSMILQIPEDNPGLRKVRIAEVFGDFEDADGPVGWNVGDISLESPGLKHLDFQFASELLSESSIAWDGITTVKMAGITVTDAVDILDEASCLELCGFGLEGDVKPLGIPIVTSALKTLHLESDSGAGVVTAFANGVTLPSLRDLSLQMSAIPIRELKSLFERSQCRVQTLTLVLTEYIPDDDILKLLNILPTVEHLIMETPLSGRKPTITNKFFESLRHPRPASKGTSSNLVLPKLKSLSYTGPMHFTWPVFLEIFPPLENINHGVARPCEVSLKLQNPKGFAGTLPRLHQIQQSNIQLIVADLGGNDLLQV